MTGWEAHGSYWKLFVDVQPQQVFVDGNNPLQQIGIPSKYFAPGSPGASKKYQSQVGTDIKDMAAGRFWWQNDTLYIWLDDSSDPNQHEIEVSQRKNIMLLSNVDGVYVKEFSSNTPTGTLSGNNLLQLSWVTIVCSTVAQYSGAILQVFRWDILKPGQKY